MRSRSFEVRLPQNLHSHPYIVGQTGINYQIFDKIGNGSYGAVYDVKMIVQIGADGQFQLNEDQEQLVVKIIDVTDDSYNEQDFLNELKVLQDISNSDFECFPKLKDWGVTSLEKTYQI